MVSSIAGVIVHISAKMGVLAGQDPSLGKIIAALLTYRMLYSFLPLTLATGCYL